MQIVLDFITGKIGCDEFKEAWYSNPEIGIWLEQLVDLKSPPVLEWSSLPYAYIRMAIHKHYGGSVLKFIAASESAPNSNTPKWLEIGWHFKTIAAIIVVAFPDIQPTSYYDREQDFFCTVVGDSFGGREVEGCISSTLSAFPDSMGMTKRKKDAKAAIKCLFHAEGAKCPRWVQEPEWPMGSKSPMAFISQKRKGDLVQFLFKDVDTNETRIVEQWY